MVGKHEVGPGADRVALRLAKSLSLARLSQLGRSAAGKPFRISGGVQEVSTTKMGLCPGRTVVE